MNCAPTLGLILRTFKALATRYLHAAGASDFSWQRNYYEHITRKEGNLMVSANISSKILTAGQKIVYI